MSPKDVSLIESLLDRHSPLDLPKLQADGSAQRDPEMRKASPGPGATDAREEDHGDIQCRYGMIWRCSSGLNGLEGYHWNILEYTWDTNSDHFRSLCFKGNSRGKHCL